MLAHLHIRRATAAPDDYAACADFAHLDGEMATPDDLLAFDRACERSGTHSWRYLAYHTSGQIIGAGHFFPVTWLPQPGTYWLTARVHPAYERHGVGTALLRQMEADLAALGAQAIWVMVPEEATTLLESLSQHGFREQMRSHPYTLRIAEAPAIDLAPAEARLAEHGLRLCTLAECRAEDADWLERIYTLHAALTRDVPIPEKIFTTREEFAAFAVEAPTALLEAFFVVRDGEHYVGLSFMQTRPDSPGTLFQELTGTLPAYRGLGLARVLKQLTIAYARANGFEQIVTWMEDTNRPMLAINAAYGFRRETGLVLLERPVEPPVLLDQGVSSSSTLPRLQTAQG